MTIPNIDTMYTRWGGITLKKINIKRYTHHKHEIRFNVNNNRAIDSLFTITLLHPRRPSLLTSCFSTPRLVSSGRVQLSRIRARKAEFAGRQG